MLLLAIISEYISVLDESHSSLLDLGSQDLPDDGDQEVHELNLYTQFLSTSL